MKDRLLKVKIGNEVREFTMQFSFTEGACGRHNTWISTESYFVHYRTGSKIHERRLVIMADDEGSPKEWNNETRSFEGVEWPEIKELTVDRGHSYGNSRSIEIPFAFDNPSNISIAK